MIKPTRRTDALYTYQSVVDPLVHGIYPQVVSAPLEKGHKRKEHFHPSKRVKPLQTL